MYNWNRLFILKRMRLFAWGTAQNAALYMAGVPLGGL